MTADAQDITRPVWSGGYDENGLPYGTGIMHYPWKSSTSEDDDVQIEERKGDTYEGVMEHGLRSGRGVYTWQDQTKYCGDYLCNTRSGQGTITYPDGSSYEGGWEDNKYQGFGTYTYRNGDKYEGRWQAGLRQGQGCLWFKDSGSQLQGRFFYGEIIEGTWLMKDGSRIEGRVSKSSAGPQGTGDVLLFKGAASRVAQRGHATSEGWQPVSAIFQATSA